MRAYTGTISREKFIKEMEWHREQDKFLRGTYGVGNEKTFMGCAVGCGLHTLEMAGLYTPKRDSWPYGNHEALSEALQIPEWIVHCQDRIFEGLGDEMSKDFPVDFCKSIKQDADLSGVHRQFLPWVLRKIVSPSTTNKVIKGIVKNAANGIESDWKELSRGKVKREAANLLRKTDNDWDQSCLWSIANFCEDFKASDHSNPSLGVRDAAYAYAKYAAKGLSFDSCEYDEVFTKNLYATMAKIAAKLIECLRAAPVSDTQEIVK